MRSILVTGASSGIGAAVARLALAQGWRVGLMARREAALAEVAGGHAEALVLPGDVTDPASVEACFERFARETGRFDVLFNNAGVFPPSGPIDALSPEDWDRAVAVNLTGMVLCARAAFAIMRRQGSGRIVNNGSVSAHAPRPNAVAYTVTKHGVTGLTRQLALDGRPLGISAGQIDIGNARTPLLEALDADMRARGEPAVPMMEADDAAASVMHMAALPPSANVLFMTVMAPGMPFVGRG